jgi:O-antigen/teichoic acid export membrane protein
LEDAGALVNGLISAVLGMHSVIGVAIVALLLLQVGIVLVGFYMRPVRTRRQFWRVALILFAGLVICSIVIFNVIDASDNNITSPDVRRGAVAPLPFHIEKIRQMAMLTQ